MKEKGGIVLIGARTMAGRWKEDFRSKLHGIHRSTNSVSARGVIFLLNFIFNN